MRWSVGVAVALLAFLLAGCADHGPSPESRSPASQWLEAYWGDAKQLPLLEKTHRVLILAGTPAADFASPTRFEANPGSLVAPGTAMLELSFSAQVSLSVIAPTFQIRYAGPDDVPSGYEIATPGDQISIPIDSSQWDVPLAEKSQWWFEILMHGSGVDDRDLAASTVTLRVAASRGDAPLPIYPPAPDPWKGATHLTLLTGAVRQFNTTYASPLIGGYGNTLILDTDSVLLPVESLVPLEATSIEAIMRYEGTGNLAPTLKYWIGGELDTLTGSFELVAVNGSERVFHLDLGDLPRDSPFQNSSVWRLALSFPSSDAPLALAAGIKITTSATVYR